MRRMFKSPCPCWCLITATLLFGGAASAGEKTRVCLVSMLDQTGRRSAGEMRRRIEASLRSSGAFEIVPLRAFAKAARGMRIPRRRWAQARSISSVAPALDIEVALMAVLSKHGRGYRLVIVAVDPSSSEQLARSAIRLPRPRLTRARAKEVIRSLTRELEENLTPAVASTHRLKSPEDGRVEDATAVDERRSGGVGGVAGDLEDDWSDVGDGDFEKIEASAPVDELKVEIGGRVQAEHFTYFNDMGGDKVAGRDNVDLAFRAKASTGSVLAAGTFLVRHDYSDTARNRLDAEEAYVQFGWGPFTLRAGRAMVSWGSASMLNPTDIINPVDLRDPLDTEKRGAWMVRAGLVLGPVLIEGYYLPVPEANLIPFYDGANEQGLPISSSRWMTEELDPGGGSLRYHLGDTAPPPPSTANAQGAVRLAASFWGMDLSAGYARIFDRMPTLRTIMTPDPPFTDVTLEFSYERVHVVTLDVERAFGKLRLAAEGAAFITEDTGDDDPEAENPYATVVIGLDYRSAEFLTDHHVHFFLDLMVTWALVGELVEGPLGGLRHPITHAGLGRVRYEMGEDLRLDLNLFSALDVFDLVINPEIELILYDKVNIRMGLLFLLGDEEEGFFARFSDNSRITASVEVSF